MKICFFMEIKIEYLLYIKLKLFDRSCRSFEEFFVNFIYLILNKKVNEDILDV